MLEVVATGALATVQDQGRIGYQHLGVPRSGALDPWALGLANRLVGNASDAAVIELCHGRFTVRSESPLLFATTGAPVPVRADGRPAPLGVPFRATQVEVGAPTHGTYTYLAVQGGIDLVPVLGSRATDTLSGIGPPPLRPGDRLPVGNAGAAPSVDFTPSQVTGDETRVRARLGPHDGWFTDPACLFGAGYRVKTGNRIGVRLTGPPLTRAVTRELPSAGLLAGAIQVPGDGQPIVFLADHPTTGGYPVIGVVHPHDVPHIAQARPGTRVVFHGP